MENIDVQIHSEQPDEVISKPSLTKKKFWLFPRYVVIVVSVFLLIVVGALGIFIKHSYQLGVRDYNQVNQHPMPSPRTTMVLEPNPLTSPVSQNTPTEINTINPLTDRQRYTSTTLGISFSHLRDTQVVENTRNPQIPLKMYFLTY